MSDDVRALVGSTFLFEPNAENDVRQILVDRLTWILDHQLDRLPHYLYRLDIPEHRVNEAFASAESAFDVPEKLADLILERLLQIAESRRRACQD